MSDKPFALIVEDAPELLDIFNTAMVHAGFQTELISDGAQALERLTLVTPDVVILDLHLPGASGQTILKTIRSTQKLDTTKVILTTADHLEANTLQDAADLVLIKPISFTQLRDLAARLVRQFD